MKRTEIIEEIKANIKLVVCLLFRFYPMWLISGVMFLLLLEATLVL